MKEELLKSNLERKDLMIFKMKSTHHIRRTLESSWNGKNLTIEMIVRNWQRKLSSKKLSARPYLLQNKDSLIRSKNRWRIRMRSMWNLWSDLEMTLIYWFKTWESNTSTCEICTKENWSKLNQISCENEKEFLKRMLMKSMLFLRNNDRRKKNTLKSELIWKQNRPSNSKI